MRAPDPSVHLTAEQQRAANTGVKAMMPLNGRPFLDFILSSLADAGVLHVGLVVAPDHTALRRYYEIDAPASRIRVDFVVQAEPLGTANAVLAAERWIAGEPFLTMNADNLYPVDVLRKLASLSEPGLPAFDAEELVASSNIPPERIGSFAILDVDEQEYLTGIVEKPAQDLPAQAGNYRGPAGWLPALAGRLISMNCWRFDEHIFRACREVPKSARGEYELPEAVGVAVRQGAKFKTFRAQGPVLDLSTRADAADVARRLGDISPRP